MIRKMTPRAILAAVQRQDFPANWRIHRVMDRFDRSILLFPIIVFFVVPIGVILAEIYRPVDPVAPVLGFSLVAEIFAYLMWRYFLKVRDAVIILLAHGLVLGNLRSGKPLFHLNYRRVTQSGVSMAERLDAHRNEVQQQAEALCHIVRALFRGSVSAYWRERTKP
jgi:hypothetical protein